MDERKAIEIMEDAIRVWNELYWFNGKYKGEASLFVGNDIQLVDERSSGRIGCLAEKIADTLHLTRKYCPTESGGLCCFKYKGYGFYSGWRTNE